jgi:hypothetical protein
LWRGRFPLRGNFVATVKRGVVKTLKMYVRFQFSSEGASPLEVIQVVADLGFQPVMGEYDFFYEVGGKYGTYRDMLRKLHEGLRGFKVLYTVTTKRE